MPQMSPEEYLALQKQKLQAYMLSRQGPQQQAPQQEGMVSQTAMTPEAMAAAQSQAAQSTAGARSRLASQQAYADKLRGTPIPEGRQVGNIYQAADPLEGLATIANRYVGGREAARLGEKYSELDVAESGAKQSKLALAVEAARVKEAGVASRSGKGRASREAISAATLTGAKERNEATIAAKKVAAEIAEAKKDKKRTQKTFHALDGKGTITLLVATNGVGFDQATGEPYPKDVVGQLTPYTAPQTGSVAVRKAKYDRELSKEKDTLLLDADLASKVITDPNLRTATGPWYDPPKLATSLGMPGYEEAQATQTSAAAVSMTAAAPILDKLGINPTDVDLKEAFKTAPSDVKQPEVWVDWYENRYMPAMSKALMRDNPEVHDRVMKEMAATVEKAKTVHEPQYNPFADEEEKTPEDSGWSVREVE